MSILILSKEQDGHIEPVAQIVRERGGEVLRMDLADIPLHASLTATMQPDGWSGSLTFREHVLDLRQITSIWWRRPTSPLAPSSYSAPEADFWKRENERGLTSLLLPAPGKQTPFWVSNPDAISSAARKPRQLAQAHALGLAVPKTLLTNNPAEARAFYDECNGEIIAKALSRGVLEPQGEYVPGQERFIYTTAIQETHLARLDQVSVMLHYFQERIQKEMDLRVVVIGKQVFAIEIHSPADEGLASLDWRRDYAALSYAVHDLPTTIEEKLLEMVRCSGLQMSSMDVILSKSGEYIFLEMNPNGQFLWPAKRTGLPLAEAMANLLMYPKDFCL